ncbi:MAG: hypothetical protein JJU00_02655 [Opitutales bacterium]|nr:hypothetical protein [Opitutales bacterium]
MKKIPKLLEKKSRAALAILGGTVLCLPAALTAESELHVLLDDTWATGERTEQSLPERSVWYASSADRFLVTEGSVTGLMEGSSRLWMTYFTNSMPLPVEVGEWLRVTTVFVPEGVNAGNPNRGFRVGLFNYGEGMRVDEEPISSSGANGEAVTGYLLNMNFSPEWGINNPLEVRRRMGDDPTHANNGNLMGSVPGGGIYGDALGNGGGNEGETGIVSGETYTMVFFYERLEETGRITISIDGPDGWSVSISGEDPNPVPGFDAFAFRPDNETRTAESITMLNFKVEYFGELDLPDLPEFRDSPWMDIAEADEYGNRRTDLGWIYDEFFPWVYIHDMGDWAWFAPESDSLASMYGYAYAHGGFFFWLSADTFDWLRIVDLEAWARWSDLPEEDLIDRFIGGPELTPHDVIPAGERTRFVATGGSNASDGTEEAPFATLNHAVNVSQPGDVIVLRGGVYSHNSTITIGTNRNGTAEMPVTVINYPGEEVIFDFSGQSKGSGNIGIRLNANYWRMIGLTIRNAGHNGIRMDGSHNRLERIVAHNNHDTGIHLAGNASHNLILNCDSYHNFNTTGRVGNNADGFGAKFENLGPGNWFYGCRAWENSDDGFDFWMALNTIIVERSWAFGNGDASVFGNPADFEGGGNGFKLGGNHVPGDHIVIRCMAFDNFGANNNAKGFDHNNNTGALTLIHNTAYNNGRNFTFPNNPQESGKRHAFYNNLSVFPGNVQVSAGSEQAGNSWQERFVTVDMVVSTDTSLAKSPRQPDGSLPDIDLLRPAPGTFMIDGGVDLGPAWPFLGSAPDMGAIEVSPGQ